MVKRSRALFRLFSAAALPAFVALLLVAAPGQSRADDKELWAALAKGGGTVALMRHALAPGTGDPADFNLGDCKTQRNLSDAGRRQARNTGKVLKQNGITAPALYTSRWCRCRETAALLGVGEPKLLEALSSFFRERHKEGPQTKALREFIAALPPDAPPQVMVTHQVNISALTDRFAYSGEIVVVKGDGKGGIEVLGAIKAQPID